MPRFHYVTEFEYPMGAVAPAQTMYMHCKVIDARLTSKADRGSVRTCKTVSKASGEEVLVCRPLRSMKRRGIDSGG